MYCYLWNKEERKTGITSQLDRSSTRPWWSGKARSNTRKITLTGAYFHFCISIEKWTFFYWLLLSIYVVYLIKIGGSYKLLRCNRFDFPTFNLLKILCRLFNIYFLMLTFCFKEYTVKLRRIFQRNPYFRFLFIQIFISIFLFQIKITKRWKQEIQGNNSNGSGTTSKKDLIMW